VLLDSSGSIQCSTVSAEKALQSILPMERTGHTLTEVGVAVKLLPSPREGAVSGNVQDLERTPVVSAGPVRDVIPEDLLSKVSFLQSASNVLTETLPGGVSNIVSSTNTEPYSEST